MKKILLMGLLILALVAMPLCAACDGDDTPVDDTPVDDTPVDDTPVDDTPTEPIHLVFNDHNPAPTGPAISYDYWAEKVLEASNGMLEIEVIHGGALFTGDEVFSAVASGACDGGHYVVDREDGFLLNLVMTLPFLGWPEQHVEAAYQTLMDEFPEMMTEWGDDITILHFMIMPATHIHFADADTVVVTPDDIAGMKIFCAEASSAEIMDAVGAVAVELPITDMAPSIQTGVVAGIHNHFPVLAVFGALELLHSHTIFGGGGVNFTPMLTIMNTDVLNGLPQDLQDVIFDTGHYWFDKFYELDAADIAAADQFCLDNGHTMTYLTDEEIGVWRDAVKTQIHDAWLADCAAAGLPGQAVYDRALELIATWGS